MRVFEGGEEGGGCGGGEAEGREGLKGRGVFSAWVVLFSGVGGVSGARGLGG